VRSSVESPAVLPLDQLRVHHDHLGALRIVEAGDGVEVHRLQKSDQVLVVGLVHGELVHRHVERHVLVERDQALRHSRQLSIVDQRLPAFVLLDFFRALEQSF
jgi:hypothetical protein